ncbi:uncharacterized protein LOC144153338 [Haemaphysalis longicornis]
MYPLPRIEDLCSGSSGGKKFTKLNLRDAYQQWCSMSHPGNGQHCAWKKEQELAFLRSKEITTKAPVLVHFHPAKHVVLTADASLYGVGAVLAHQEKNGQGSPLDKEGLSLMFGVQHFHQYLWCRKVEAVTYHKPLLGLLGLTRPFQCMHHLECYWLVYHPVKDLAPADGLIRLPLPEMPAVVPEPAEVFMLEHAYPEVLSRSAVSQLLHAGRPGMEKTKMVARSHVWRPSLDQDIARMVQGCQMCQENQRALSTVEVTHWPFLEKPWSHLHVDFVGPFKGPCFLGVLDAFSKWDLPDIIVPDNGAAFASEE